MLKQPYRIFKNQYRHQALVPRVLWIPGSYVDLDDVEFAHEAPETGYIILKKVKNIIGTPSTPVEHGERLVVAPAVAVAPEEVLQVPVHLGVAVRPPGPKRYTAAMFSFFRFSLAFKISDLCSCSLTCLSPAPPLRASPPLGQIWRGRGGWGREGGTWEGE